MFLHGRGCVKLHVDYESKLCKSTKSRVTKIYNTKTSGNFPQTIFVCFPLGSASLPLFALKFHQRLEYVQVSLLLAFLQEGNDG